MAGDVDAVNEREWREGWELKVVRYINMTRSVYANMRREQSGIIINIIVSIIACTTCYHKFCHSYYC